MADDSTVHVPVLMAEVLQALQPAAGRVFVDGTLGAGGHTRALADRVAPDGSIIAVDRDPAALARAERVLAGLPVTIAHANYCDVPEVLETLRIARVDGILLDLGMSSDQLADDARGFSFDASGDLDLRFDPTAGEPAWRLVNRLSREHLTRILTEYGEERYSRRIAQEIVSQRRQQPIRRARDLAALVRRCVPTAAHHRIDSATRTFQALRIAVNRELESLRIALKRLPDLLAVGGRLAVISFHSLEDRLVKEAFRDDERMKALTRKPIRAGEAEVARNRRSSSARMRVAERVEPA